MTESSDRTDPDASDSVHEVEFAEYSALLISRRRLERDDLEEGALLDVDSGERYVLKKRSGSPALQQSV